MANSSDDDIEFLNPVQGANAALQNTHSNLNPLHLFSRCPSIDESSAPLHALHTAFTSLQQKHNLQTQKYNEVLQENKLMKRSLREYPGFMDVHGNKAGSMDDNITVPTPRMEQSLAHAAGGTSEDDAVAERRANEGRLRQLQKEVMLRDNLLSSYKEEIDRLKFGNKELQLNLSKHLHDKDHLQYDQEVILNRVEEFKHLCEVKDSEINVLRDSLDAEKQANERVAQENTELLQKIEMYERNAMASQSGEVEVRDLISKVSSLENEKKNLHAQLREFDALTIAKQALEARCRQFEIHVDINRDNQQSQRQQEEDDDVDGDITTLRNALDLVEHQKREYAELKTKVSQQAEIIKQLAEYKGIGGKMLEVRDEAQGTSFHGTFQENSHPLYMNTNGYYANTGQQVKRSQPPMIERRRSDRGDYRGMKQPSVRNDDTGLPHSRIVDAVVPTGTQNIARMVAQVSQPVGKWGSANVPNSGNGPLSPRSAHCGDGQDTGTQLYSPPARYVNTQDISTSTQLSPANSHYTTRFENNPDVTVGEQTAFTADNVTDSKNWIFDLPITRPEHPTNPDHTQGYLRNDNKLEFNGARPRIHTNSTNALDLEHHKVVEPPSPRLPLRMTQSEVHIRDFSPNVGRSHVPESNSDVPYVNTSQNYAPFPQTSQDFRQTISPPRNSDIPQSNTSEYENVYSPRTQTDTKLALEDDDSTFMTACEVNVAKPNHDNFGQFLEPKKVKNTGVTNTISTLKICPVCDLECSRSTIDEFQMHVIECFDNSDESPATLQAQPADSGNNDRTCPMCNKFFPMTVPQDAYEQHVLGHFEEPAMDRFEIVERP